MLHHRLLSNASKWCSSHSYFKFFLCSYKCLWEHGIATVLSTGLTDRPYIYVWLQVPWPWKLRGVFKDNWFPCFFWLTFLFLLPHVFLADPSPLTWLLILHLYFPPWNALFPLIPWLFSLWLFPWLWTHIHSLFIFLWYIYCIQSRTCNLFLYFFLEDVWVQMSVS